MGQFWIKIRTVLLRKKQTRGLCQCKLTHVNVENLGYCDFVPLRDGHHTNFALTRCGNCGGFKGFPEGNFTLALEEGTKEFLIELGKTGVDVTPYLEKIARKEKVKVMLI